ncbi:MAG: YbhB/YbcL family Raf kinase inhibitor-like protein [Parvularculaceae bacterium]
MKFAAAIAVFLLAASPAAAMELASKDLKNGGSFDKNQVYGQCGGKNRAPRLEWSGAPVGTTSFALAMIDESVKPQGFLHWYVLGLPAAANEFGGENDASVRARVAGNDFGDEGYGGPCPPKGSGPHKYVITVWALGAAAPDIKRNMRADALARALDKVALDKASLAATYERK